jgi:hypothetical protein
MCAHSAPMEMAMALGVSPGAKHTIALLTLTIAVALTISGCGRALTPRTSAPLDTTEWNQGALIDASRAYPVAFWADACKEPEGRVVASDNLLTGQWLAHFSRALNEAVARAGLYDTRFGEIHSSVLGGELVAGEFVYKCNPDSVALVRRSATRIVQITLKSADRVVVVSDRAVVVVVEVHVGKQTLQYQAHSIRSGWDAEVFSQLGRSILGDPGFWQAVAAPF